MKLAINKIINFIYPPSCYLCKEAIENKGLCLKCYSAFKVVKYYCEKCGLPFENYTPYRCCVTCLFKENHLFDSFHYTFMYSHDLYKLLARYKYGDDTNLALFLSRYLDMPFQEIIAKHKIDIIIPMPVHLFKIIKRKFNHIALLAKIIAKNNDYTYNPLILKKIKHTKDQVGLNSKERRANLKGAFAINEKYLQLIRNKNILLLDDVVTTGTTIKECSKLLKLKGVKEVHILTLARVQGIIKN